MSPSHEQDRAEFQRAIDALAHNAVLPLMPREYPGPIVLNHPLVIDGQGSTIWALKGPVISSQSDGIVLRNLRIEVTGELDGGQSEDHCVLRVERGYPPKFENVEVRGSIIGIPEEEGDWRYPRSLQIGSVPFGSETDLIMRLWAPVPCEISSKISGLEIQPHHLEPGTNEVTLHIERIAKDTLLNGFLYLTTPNLRRSIAVNGYVSAVKAKKSRSKKLVGPTIVYQPSDWETLLTRPRPQLPVKLPPPPPPPPDPAGVSHPDAHPDPVVSSEPPSPVTSPVVAPQFGGPSGPSIQWPPPPAPPVQPPSPPVLPPTLPPVSPPPVVPPVAPLSPPPVSSPVIGPSGGSSSGTAPVPGPTGRRKLLVAGVLGLVLILLVFAAWWFFFSGGNRLNYDTVKLERTIFASDEVKAVAVSPDGTLVAGGSKDGVIKVWEASTGLEKQRMPRASDVNSLSEITSLAFSADGKMLASGRADTNVVIWDPQTGERLNTCRGHLQRVNAVAFSSAGVLASGGDDAFVRLWDAKASCTQSKPALSLDQPVKAVAFSSDGTIVAGGGGSQDGRLRMWDVASGSFKSPELTRGGIITSLCFSSDGKVAAGAADGTVAVWNVQTRELRTLRGHTAQVNGVVFSPLGESIVSGGADNLVLLWNADDYGTFKRKLTENAGPVYAIAMSFDGKLIASGGADKTVRLWVNK
jgi:hypothetical protein